MAVDLSELVVGANGEVYTAPLATAVPADVSTAWPAGWVDLGAINTDGVEPSPSMDTKDYEIWQSVYPALTTVTGRTLEFSFTLAQFAPAQVTLAWGGGTVTEPTPGLFRYEPPPPEDLDERMLGVEWRYGDNTYRWVVIRGRVSELSGTKISREDPIELPIAYKMLDPGGGADPWFILTDDPAWDPS